MKRSKEYIPVHKPKEPVQVIPILGVVRLDERHYQIGNITFIKERRKRSYIYGGVFSVGKEIICIG